MDPLSIATSVVGLTATCLSTCKKLHDIAGNYKDAPVIIAMICSESTVISMCLSELQMKILRRDDLSQAWASRTEVWITFETALTGCMTVFSCLEAETRRLQSRAPGVWAKLKFIWNQDRLKELLGALRAQQASINLLLQILETDTLSGIQQDIRKITFQIQATASEAQSLRSRNPSIRMKSQSIFDNDTRRLSVFDVKINSVVAPSELDFEFDDLVLNSQVYRRAFVKAQVEGQQPQVPNGEEAEHSDTATVREASQELMTAPFSSQVAVKSSPSRNGLGEESNTMGSMTKEITNSHEEQVEVREQKRHQDEGNILSPQPVKPPVCELEGDLPNDFRESEADDSNAVAARSANERSASNSAQATRQHSLKLSLVRQRQCATLHDQQNTTASELETPNNQDKPNSKGLSWEGRYSSRMCFTCSRQLKGNYIATTYRYYHIQHFVCDKCNTCLTTKTAFCGDRHMVYCYKHFCDNYGERCYGCEFPFCDNKPAQWNHANCQKNREICCSCNYPTPEQYTETIEGGMKRKWHTACYSAAEDCGIVVPLWLKGCLLTVPPDFNVSQEQRESYLQRVLQATSKFLKAFGKEVSLVLKRAERAEGFEHWKHMITLVAYLFHVTTEPLPGGIGDESIKTFSVVFQEYFAASSDSESELSSAIEERIVEAIKPVLKVGINKILTKTIPELILLLDKFDGLLSELSTPRLSILRLLYAKEPTGDEEDFECQRCKESITNGAFAEFSALNLMWHPKCWQCPGCRQAESVVTLPTLDSNGAFKCNWKRCGREGGIELIPSYAFAIYDMWRVWGQVHA